MTSSLRTIPRSPSPALPDSGAFGSAAARAARASWVALAALMIVASRPAPLHATAFPDELPVTPRVGAEVICGGDCNYDGMNRIDELLTGVNIALGLATPDRCVAIDREGDGTAGVEDLVGAVANALSGCPTARFVTTECHIPTPDGQDPAKVMCGDLIVPENRAARNGRTIHLALEVLKATGPAPEPDPFVNLSGGPGQWAIDTLGPLQTAEFLMPIQSKRDVILFDPRGTGRSQPALDCPELVQPRDAFNEALTPEQEVERDAAGLLACRDRLVAEGVDLAAYTSAATAQDIAGLMQALGYERYNLYGLSYGTRVALTALRDLPAGRIRSVVLDSAVPLQADISLAFAKPTADSLALAFADCASQQACNDAYPDLSQAFFDVVEQLNASPPTVQSATPEGQPFSVVLTGDRFVTLVGLVLQEASVTPFLPLLIQAAANGNMGILAEAVSVFGRSLNGFDSIGLTTTVICNEDNPFVTTAAVDALNQGIDPRILHAFPNPDFFGRVCPEWGTPAPDPAENAAVVSDVPALVLAGQYDPSTPPAWSAMVAATLSHSTLLEFRGFGHVVLGQQYAPTGPPSCAMQVIAQFIDDPSRAPDRSCVDELPPPTFFTG